MKVISSGAERFLTSDAVADSVLEYAGVLARAGSADTISIPFVDDSGAEAEARLLLGPASQLSLLPGDGASTVLRTEPEVLSELRRRTGYYEPGPIAVDPAPGASLFIDFDQPTG